MILAVPIRQPYQTRYKLPLMNWSVLRNQQLRNTIFVGMNDEKVIGVLDMDRFEELFRLSCNTIGSKNRGSVDEVASSKTGLDLDGTDNVDGDNKTPKTAKKPVKKRLMDANRHR